MNKIAAYLNEHLTGEVFSDAPTRKSMETDGGVLLRTPEIVVHPANTNDIRKVVRFCAQLAEKGHTIPVVARGHGTDGTSGAVSDGIVLDMTAYMHRVEAVDPTRQLIHVQSGISLAALNATLSTHKGLGVAQSSYTHKKGTLGGAIALNALGTRMGVHLSIVQQISQMEVVLSNGDLIQTGKISRRELNKKKGLATLEGEIYRQVDNLISDNEELISRLNDETPETVGYAGIAKVRTNNSFDLTPLFAGSQSSLGIITEVILKADFVHQDASVVVTAHKTVADAQTAAEFAEQCKAGVVEIYDGKLFMNAIKQGKTFAYAPRECHNGAVTVAIFDDFSARNRTKYAKKYTKKLAETQPLFTETKQMELSELHAFHSVLELAKTPQQPHTTVPTFFSDIWLPVGRLDGFLQQIRQLEQTYTVTMPFFVDSLRGTVALFPSFDVKKVSDRQKMLKLCAEITNITNELGGTFAGGGDGRIKSAFMYPKLDEHERALYEKIKAVFDPAGVLGTGVKGAGDVKQIATELNAWCRHYMQ